MGGLKSKMGCGLQRRLLLSAALFLASSFPMVFFTSPAFALPGEKLDAIYKKMNRPGFKTMGSDGGCFYAKIEGYISYTACGDGSRDSLDNESGYESIELLAGDSCTGNLDGGNDVDLLEQCISTYNLT